MVSTRSWKRPSFPGLALALVGLADNVSTWLAVSKGAVELNPLVAPFLSSPGLWWGFTVFKVVVLYWVGKALNLRKPADTVIYSVLVFFFARATVVNMLNWVGR